MSDEAREAVEAYRGYPQNLLSADQRAIVALGAELETSRKLMAAVVGARGIHRYYKPMDVAIDAMQAHIEDADAD